ncbi:DUF3592 domain-containing protein [Alkalicoccobacillus gibsonii]|uniref:DUF3592 domain-containing protein n=1 Tax=Alkalicoccobacillus gibsonii TaxID=79881 RepID=UPI0035147B6E
MSTEQLISIIFLAIARVPALILSIIAARIRSRKKSWVKVYGEIVRNDSVSMSEGLRPTIEFTTVENQTIQVTSKAVLKPGFRLGRKMYVYYHPDKPNKTLWDHFLFNGNLLFLIAFLLLGLYLFFFSYFYFEFSFLDTDVGG